MCPSSRRCNHPDAIDVLVVWTLPGWSFIETGTALRGNEVAEDNSAGTSFLPVYEMSQPISTVDTIILAPRVDMCIFLDSCTVHVTWVAVIDRPQICTAAAFVGARQQTTMTTLLLPN
jgi:hypothetical protein